ncbi:MAG: hypothetical protein ACI85I_001223 [Arenicella sp.]|jgi:hypothetical protein
MSACLKRYIPADISIITLNRPVETQKTILAAFIFNELVYKKHLYKQIYKIILK